MIVTNNTGNIAYHKGSAIQPGETRIFPGDGQIVIGAGIRSENGDLLPAIEPRTVDELLEGTIAEMEPHLPLLSVDQLEVLLGRETRTTAIAKISEEIDRRQEGVE